MVNRLGAAALAGVLSLVTATAGCSSGSDEPDAGQLVPGPCPVFVPREFEVGCGALFVLSDHDDPEGGVIALSVAVLAAQQDTGKPPLIVLAGGPGESLVVPSLTALAETPYPVLAADRDVVLLDQRGAGASAPSLACPELALARAAAAGPQDLRGSAAAAKACRDRLVEEQGVDLADFTTPQNVRDIGVLRAALGAEQVDLLGTSYGARLAIQIGRGAPPWVRAMVLSSPIPAQENYVADAAASFDRAVLAIDQACAAQPSCAVSYPDVAERIRTLVAALDDEPAPVPIVDAATGQVRQVTVSGQVLARALFTMLFAEKGALLLPYVVTRLSAGDPTVLTTLISAGAAQQTATGQQLSFLCAEEATQVDLFDLADGGDLGVGARAIAGSPILGPNLLDLCARWDVPAAEGVFEPVDLEVPVLAVSGEFDQITPPSYGTDVARRASTAYEVVVPGAGHGPLLLEGECGALVTRDFLDDPSTEPATSCLLRAAPFPTPEQVPSTGGLGATLTAS